MSLWFEYKLYLMSLISLGVSLKYCEGKLCFLPAQLRLELEPEPLHLEVS